MRVAVASEVANNEFRVAITSAGALDLITDGHEVIVQVGAGRGSTITDKQHVEAGATIVEDATLVWQATDIRLKTKEPVAPEYRHFREGLVIFRYLRLATEAARTCALPDTKVTAIGHETVQLPSRELPRLAAMSEFAARLSALVGAKVVL